MRWFHFFYRFPEFQTEAGVVLASKGSDAVLEEYPAYLKGVLFDDAGQQKALPLYVFDRFSLHNSLDFDDVHSAKVCFL